MTTSDTNVQPQTTGLNKILEIILTMLSIIGTAILSAGYQEGFLFYFTANVTGIILFKRLNMKWMLWTQVAFILASINGIYQHLL